jgi:cell division protein ZipA
MSLREWLIAIGSLIVIGVVIDGIRRVRRARKESVAISSGMGADDLDASPLDDEFNPELPNGGARTISHNAPEDRGYLTPHKPRFGNPPPKPTRPVTERSAPAPEPARESEPEEHDMEPLSASRDEPDLDVGADWNDGVVSEPRAVEPPVITTEVEEDTARRKPARTQSDQPLAGANRPEAREVVVINVLASSGQDFSGTRLKALFEACGLQHGDLDIYHRHEETDTRSPVQFSVASAVEPGTFRPRDMATLSTPGISFFMSMPGPSSSLQAFEFMLETAQCVVSNLGGELKDERRSVMTPQTIEHCRQRIREFERKKRSPEK